MAGPAIRFELSRALARELEVVLASRHEPALDGEGFEVVGYGGDEEGALRSLVEKTDVLLAFGPLLLDHPWIGETGVPVIADLYDPAPLEALVMHADLAMDVQRARHRAVLAAHRALLERGDVFLCASERQRHLVVGMLAALGRVEPLTFAGDPGLDDLVRVVPFGVPSEPPTPVSPSPLRDAHPAMQPDDFLLLWAGGIYEWLDPVVLVEALSASTIRRSRRSSWAAATRHRPSRTCRSPPEWLLGPRSWGSRAAEWCSPTSGSPTTSGRGTCATPTWACPSTRTTSRPSTPSGPVCSTTSGRACRSCVPTGTPWPTWCEPTT